MAPRDTPGIPGTRLPKAAQEVVARPRANSHGDSEPPLDIEIDDGTERASVVDFERAVHASYGQSRFSGPAWVILILAALATAVACTYFVTRNSDGARPPQDEVLGKLQELKAQVDKRDAAQDLHDALLLQRVGTLESQNGANQARLDAILAQLRGSPMPVNLQVSQALTQPHK